MADNDKSENIDKTDTDLGVPSLTQTLRRTITLYENAKNTDIDILKLLPSSEQKYELFHELGRGGMGKVVLVRDLDIRRDVAMKLLHEGSNAEPEDIARFVQEAQITGQLEHPNIIPVHELGCGKEGQIYFTMKRVKGCSLAEILFKIKHNDEATIREFPLRKLLHTFMKVCDAVAYAHHKGVIHRDLKPENIMVGRFGEVLVMDWGLAKILKQEQTTKLDIAQSDKRTISRVSTSTLDTGTSLTMKGTVAGTPNYMSPEQAAGNLPLDYRTDIYALGSTLYEILTLSPPYRGEHSVIVLRQVLDAPPPTPRQKAPRRRIPKELEAITLKAMARKPEDRYNSAEELAEDIRLFLEQRPIAVFRETILTSSVKWVKRNPTLAVALFSLIVISLISAFLAFITLDSLRTKKSALEAKKAALEENEKLLKRALAHEKELSLMKDRELKRTKVQKLLLERNKIAVDINSMDAHQRGKLLALCDKILEIEPNHIKTRLDRIQLRLAIGDFKNAQIDCEYLEKLIPENPTLDYFYALLLSKLRKYNRALRLIEKAVKHNSNNFKIQFLYIMMLGKTGHYKKAHSVLERLKFFPMFKPIGAKLHIVCWSEEQKVETQSAPLKLERTLLFDKLIRDALFAVAQSRYSLAQQAFEKLCQNFPSNIIGWYGLACVHTAKLDYEKAFVAFKVAWQNGLKNCPYDIVELDPDISRLKNYPPFKNWLKKQKKK